ncbi:MAG: CRISPR-associated endoribonuclease Cas6 [Thermoproteota archaeon]
MRLLLKLKANGDYVYDPSINHKIQGFIYDNLANSFFGDLHNKPGSKYFCFSNIFPIGNIKKDSEVNLIISSPIREIIDIIAKRLHSLKVVNFGDYSFNLTHYKKFFIKIGNKVKLINSTPIILRIPKEKLNSKALKSRKFEYYYWRKGFDLNLFLEQLNENLKKKYYNFYGIREEIPNVFEQIKFKGEVSPMVQINGKNVKMIGSYWELSTTLLDSKLKHFVKFIIDTGLGEMNSLGFGFVNEAL